MDSMDTTDVMSAGMPTPPLEDQDAFASVRSALDVLCAFIAIQRGQDRIAVARTAAGAVAAAAPPTTTAGESALAIIDPEDLERLNFPLSPDQWFALHELLWPPSENDRLAARLAQQRRRHAAAEAAAAGFAVEAAAAAAAGTGTGVIAAAAAAAPEAVEAAESRRRLLVWDLEDAVGQLQPPLALTLEELGAFVENTVALDYFLSPAPTLTIRRPGPLHGRLGLAVTRLLFARLEEVLGMAESDNLWEQSETAIRFIDADTGDGGFVVEETCPDAGIGYVSDGSNDNDHYFPGIVVEISFSNDRFSARRARDYIEKSNGHIRCVVSIIVEYRPRSQLMLDGLPPVGVWLDAIHKTEHTEGWDPVTLVQGLDVRAAVAGDPQCRLPLSLSYLHGPAIADAADADPVHVPLAQLLDAIDREYGPAPGSYEAADAADAAAAAPPPPPPPAMANGCGPTGKRKRGRTPVPDSREGEGRRGTDAS
ncbi:hypothetical protein RB594_007793 [Gaeumannomyces avenae]